VKPRLGLIVNPVAGMGGRVALKGSDGAATLAKARERGAVPVAPGRAVEALALLASLIPGVELLAAPGPMGADEAAGCGLAATVVGSASRGETTAADTRAAAAELAGRGIDLLLFAGGDGTAVDVLEAVGDRVPVLGIPAGVKMHSAVFGVNPRSAGELAVLYLEGRTTDVRAAEVMDVDEDELREGVLSPRLHGYLRVPVAPNLVQGLKSRSARGEGAALAGIARQVLEAVPSGCLCLLGPGTTTAAVTAELGFEHTLLGVDVVRDGRLVVRDAGEPELLDVLSGAVARIVVTPVGGQGFLFGRGNQQLSPLVIRAVGIPNIIVVATESKLVALGGRPLLVDTGDPELDVQLAGYTRVVTGYREESVYRVGT
jgi:predicted polyphosphate/ATP-dependent NAD kinase